LAGFEPFERQAGVRAAVEVPDGMANRLEHAPDLSVPALVERELDP
jgi:hypothetical protein